MLGCVYGAPHAKYILSPPDFEVIGKREAVVREACPPPSSAKQRHPDTTCSAVQVQAELRAPGANLVPSRFQYARDCWIGFEYGRKSRFRHDTNFDIRASRFQKLEARSGQNTIAQRA